MTLDELRQALAGARAALLEAMSGLTERDFAQEVDGATLTQWLAALAPAERDAVRRTRHALGLEERVLPTGREAARVLPPQVVHDLAGARYETLLVLEAIAALEVTALAQPADSGDSVAGVLGAVAQQDIEAARRITAREPRAQISG